MVMIPNINAVNYYKIKEVSKEKNELRFSILNKMDRLFNSQFSLILNIIFSLVLIIEIALVVYWTLFFYFDQPFPLPIGFLKSLILGLIGAIMTTGFFGILLLCSIVAIFKVLIMILSGEIHQLISQIKKYFQPKWIRAVVKGMDIISIKNSFKL
jgi:hypothetical protein